MVLGSKMAINYIKTVGVSVFQPCLLDLEAPPKGRDRRLGITRHLFAGAFIFACLGHAWLRLVACLLPLPFGRDLLNL